MNNYSEMSDFEINKAVAIVCGYAEESCDFGLEGKPDVGVEWNEDTGYPSKSFDYCNSWADAGPIIQNNGIGLKRQSNGLWVSAQSGGLWPIYHENPLRCAMIVFLMMQEGV